MRSQFQILGASAPQAARARDYLLLESTVGLCPECLARLDAKILTRRGQVFIERCCPRHGPQLDLLEEDLDYYLARNQFARPATRPAIQTAVQDQCPFDCGLCPNHEQHTCIALIEITSACDLRCPVCYANASTAPGLSFESFDRMLDFAIDSEGGSLDILQLSGGEPVLHPRLPEFIALAQDCGVRNVLLNTNGLALATQPELLRRLQRFQSGFELYFQFDSLSDGPNERLRGKPLLESKLQALRTFSEHQIPVTLVMSVAAGLNDHELGSLIVKALNTRFVRGISFQPMAFFGRIPAGEIDRTRRVTLSGIVSRIESQMRGIIRREHLIPLPCDVDRVAVGYFRRTGPGAFAPFLSRSEVLANLDQLKNTLRFSPEDFPAAKTGIGATSCCGIGEKVLGCLPASFLRLGSPAEKARTITETMFRITVTSFIDAYNFDLRSAQRECVHVVTPDLKRIPFSAYNICHRKRYAAAGSPTAVAETPA